MKYSALDSFIFKKVKEKFGYIWEQIIGVGFCRSLNIMPQFSTSPQHYPQALPLLLQRETTDHK